VRERSHSRLTCPNKCADKLPVHIPTFGLRKRRNRCARAAVRDIAQSIASCHLNVDIREARFVEQLPISIFFQSTGNAASPRLKITSNGIGKTPLEDDI